MAKNLLDIWPKLGEVEKRWVSWALGGNPGCDTDNTHQFADREIIRKRLSDFHQEHGPAGDDYWQPAYDNLMRLLK